MNTLSPGSLVVVSLFLVALAIGPSDVAAEANSTTAPAIEPRGELSGVERRTIEVFNRVSPPVIQMVLTDRLSAAGPSIAAEAHQHPKSDWSDPLKGDGLVAAILGHIGQEIRSARERTLKRFLDRDLNVETTLC